MYVLRRDITKGKNDVIALRIEACFFVSNLFLKCSDHVSYVTRAHVHIGSVCDFAFETLVAMAINWMFMNQASTALAT
jgi:hypothetical protein